MLLLAGLTLLVVHRIDGHLVAADCLGAHYCGPSFCAAAVTPSGL